MMPEFEIFGLTFPSYWTMCAVGMLLIVAMSWLRADVYGITFLKALILALCIDVFGVAGVMPLWLAVFADVGVMLLAVLNSLRMRMKIKGEGI